MCVVGYRMRNSVYTNKKDPNGDPRGIFFISENLTKDWTELVKNLSQLKYSNQIYTYWTSDGRIYVKETETSRKQTVNNFDVGGIWDYSTSFRFIIINTMVIDHKM
jgi:hypothetical protein